MPDIPDILQELKDELTKISAIPETPKADPKTKWPYTGPSGFTYMTATSATNWDWDWYS